MSFIRQTSTLIYKDLILQLFRQWFTTTIRALIFPVVFMAIMSELPSWIYPAGKYGVSQSFPLRSFEDALSSSGARDKILIVDGGHKQGDIAQVVDILSTTVKNSGKDLHVLDDETQFPALCPASPQGGTGCFGAVSFTSSPDTVPNGNWTYKLTGDSDFTASTNAFSTSNPIAIYALPFQNAINEAILQVSGKPVVSQNLHQIAYTTTNQTYQESAVNENRQGLIESALATAYFINIVGIVYHLVGHMARERETGVSGLLEAMSPSRRWSTRASRLLAYHISFDLIYLPGWLIAGALVGSITFPATNAGYLVLLQLLCGLAMTSYSLLAGSFFKKAQLSGIIAVIIALVLGIAAQLGIGESQPDYIIQLTSFLFPPMAYVYFFIATAKFESYGYGNDLNLLPSYSSTFGYRFDVSGWNVAGSFMFGMFVVQIILFPILALAVETIRHSPSSRGRVRDFNDTEKSAISIRNFSKIYKTGNFRRWIGLGKTVPAVHDLSLDVASGSITILLGANGSGKSTTLSAVSGLDSLTEGEIRISATGGLGLCPQKNVQWDDLTVHEHITILERFKGVDNQRNKDEVNRIITACDLAPKSGARSKTLSGGQKRKLQLAMMFAGGSKVCCADEVSSGIDPLARRKIWDILLAERGQRTVLLTTHFLDEADFLSDHIVMLSQGRLKAEGTAAQLKSTYGDEYRVIVARDQPIELSSANSWVKMHREYGHLVYHLPTARDVTYLVSDLESKGVFEYSVHGPTIEDVFLKLAEEVKWGLGESRNSGTSEVSMKTLIPQDAAMKPLDLSTGKNISFWRQLWILFCKRWIILPHNWLPYVGAAFVPLVAAGLVTRFFNDFKYPDGIPCAHESGSSYTPLASDLFVGSSFIYGNAADITPTQLNQSALGILRSNLTTVTNYDAFYNYFKVNQTKAQYGGFWHGAGAPPTFAYPLSGLAEISVVLLNAFNNLLNNVRFDIQLASFATPFFPEVGNTLQIVIYTGLCFSVYPPLFALYTTGERLRNVRALHYSNGIRSTPLWLAYLAFDFWFVLIISVIFYAVWMTHWGGWYHLDLVFAVFFLYGLAATSFSHCVSLFFPSQLAAWAVATVWQVATGALYFLGTILTPVYAPGNLSSTWGNYQYFTIALVSPSVSLYRAVILTLNEFSILCRGPFADEIAPNAIAIDVFGGPILYLVVQFIVFTAFLILWEYGWRPQLWPRRKGSKDLETTAQYTDADAKEESWRLDPSNDGLRAINLNKSFGSNVAVENVSFGIQKSESFALLGPNGAGKSTIISLIRGDLRPTGNSSEVVIQGDSIDHELYKARSHLGVCPQFDAVDTMTVRQHLAFYARARGVPEVDRNVNTVMDGVGLGMYSNRLAAKLSGGNKRKLSLAIALVGNPAALLLDEPSSGMDAAAKRALWNILKSITAGRVMVLTTHSMEEADALCQRAGIIARRTLAIGSTENLREKFGSYLSVHIVHKDAPHTSKQDLDAMRQWVMRHVPGSTIETRTYHGQLRFTVTRGAHLEQEALQENPQRAHGAGMLFRLLEAHKEELGIAFYSISPPSLDQVFLSVVGKHEVQEENYEEEEKQNRSNTKLPILSKITSLRSRE